MPRTLTYLALGVVREEIPEYPPEQQGLPEHTAAEAAAYYLTFLKRLLEIGPGLFLDGAYPTQFETLLDGAIQNFNTNNIGGALTQIEDQILPAITQMVVPENRVAFRDILNTVEYGVLFPGENYYTPPLDNLLSQDIKECVTIKGWAHITEKPNKCTKRMVSMHIETIEPEEEE